MIKKINIFWLLFFIACMPVMYAQDSPGVMQRNSSNFQFPRGAYELGFRLPRVCGIPSGTPRLLDQSYNGSKGAMVYDTCNNKLRWYNGSAWDSISNTSSSIDSITVSNVDELEWWYYWINGTPTAFYATDKRTGVLYGLKVELFSPPRTYSVSFGRYRTPTGDLTAGPTTFTLDAPDAQPRYDIVVLPGTTPESVSVVKGTPSATPLIPAAGSGQVVIATFFVSAESTSPVAIPPAQDSGAYRFSQVLPNGNIVLTRGTNQSDTLWLPFAPATHTHAIADITGLQTALDGKQAAGSYAAATHNHIIDDVTGLQTALNGKANTSHTHTASQVTDFAATVRSTTLAGLATTSEGQVSALESVLAGIGRLQAQVNAIEYREGMNWTLRQTPVQQWWSDVEYGNGLFVAVGQSVMTSPDGITWTLRNAAEQNSWASITYGNGIFVAVSNNGTNRVMTSPDGITWTARAAAEANSWNNITFGNGLFVAISSNGTNRVMTSPDGITWTARSSPINFWEAVTFGNGLFVAVGGSGANRVMTSPDGINWTAGTIPLGDWGGVCYGNGLFLAVSQDGLTNFVTSPDGITWTSRSVPGTLGQYRACIYANGMFVVMPAFTSTNSRILTSPNGITWTIRFTPQLGTGYQGIAYNNGLFVAVSYNGTNRVITSGRKINEFLPSQSGNAGRVLGTDGTNISWVTSSGGGLSPDSAILNSPTYQNKQASIRRLQTDSLTAGPTTINGGLDIATTSGALRMPRLTAAQRLALTPLPGMMVYDLDSNAVFWYTSVEWIKTANDAELDPNPVFSIKKYQAMGAPIKAITAPIELANGSRNLSDGVLEGVAIPITKATPVSKIWWYQTTAGVYVGDNENRVAIYSHDGSGTITLIASSSNNSEMWKNANTFSSASLTSGITLQPGTYFITALYNNSSQTTAPTLIGPNGVAGANGGGGLFTNSNRIRFVLSGQSTLPSTISLSSVSNNLTTPIFALE